MIIDLRINAAQLVPNQFFGAIRSKLMWIKFIHKVTIWPNKSQTHIRIYKVMPILYIIGPINNFECNFTELILFIYVAKNVQTTARLLRGITMSTNGISSIAHSFFDGVKQFCVIIAKIKSLHWLIEPENSQWGNNIQYLMAYQLFLISLKMRW